MSDQEAQRKEFELITLVQLSKDSGIPLRTLKSAIKAGRMWGKKQGRDWFSTTYEVQRFKTMWRKHST